MVIKAILGIIQIVFQTSFFFLVDTTIIFQNLKNQQIGHKTTSLWLDALCVVMEITFGFYFVFITILKTNVMICDLDWC
jgi:hypothetical protein